MCYLIIVASFASATVERERAGTYLRWRFMASLKRKGESQRCSSVECIYLRWRPSASVKRIMRRKTLR